VPPPPVSVQVLHRSASEVPLVQDVTMSAPRGGKWWVENLGDGPSQCQLVLSTKFLMKTAIKEVASRPGRAMRGTGACLKRTVAVV
jgi:hypothetical protein